MNFSLTIRILEIRLLLLLFRDVALYCMIRDSSMAINDWRIYPRLVAVIYLYRRTLTHGRRSHSCGHAQSCISVGLVWSFGTIIKSRMKVFDCRRQTTDQRHPPPLSSHAAASDTFDLSVMLLSPLLMKHNSILSATDKKSVYQYTLKMTYSV